MPAAFDPLVYLKQTQLLSYVPPSLSFLNLFSKVDYALWFRRYMDRRGINSSNKIFKLSQDLDFLFTGYIYPANKTCYFGQILSARQNLREFF